MRLANADGRAALVVTDGVVDGVVDLAEATNGRLGPDLPGVYERWDELREAASELAGPQRSLESVQLGPPSPLPRQVFGIGLNYRAHAAESGLAVPEVPATFTKFPTSIAGPFDDIPLPAGAETVDWEVELVVVIGRRAHHVDEARAWHHVAGLTVGQDISERTLQFAAGSQFSLGKSYPAFGPTGPWLVTPDELDDPNDLALGCSIDGETVQDARTSDLVFSVGALVAELSAVVPLLPGDIIFTGTPAGVGFTRTPPRFLHAGEALETWIDGIGSMRNRIVSS